MIKQKYAFDFPLVGSNGYDDEKLRKTAPVYDMSSDRSEYVN